MTPSAGSQQSNPKDDRSSFIPAGEARLGAPSWQFTLFGGMRILHRGLVQEGPPSRAHPLLAALLLHARPLRRVYLAGLFFPDHPEIYGKRRISDLLWLLRKALPELPIEADKDSIYLPADLRRVDVEAFRAEAQSKDPAAWETAIARYRGDLLPDIYDDWTLMEREQLLLTLIHLLQRLVDWRLEENDYQGAIPVLQRLVHIEPLDEVAVYNLIQAYACTGRRGAALGAYECYLSLCAEADLLPDMRIQDYARLLEVEYDRIAQTIQSFGRNDSQASPIAIARAALWRGERWKFSALLAGLNEKSANGGQAAHEHLLLEIDGALAFDDPTRAAALLEALPADLPAALARRALLANLDQDPHRASELAGEALLAAQELNDPALAQEALLALCDAQMRQGEMSQAVMTADKALNLARAHNAPRFMAQALLARGWIRLRQGHLERSLSALRQAYELACDAGLRVQAAHTAHAMAQIENRQGKFSQALESTRAELQIWRDMGSGRREAQALQNLATIECQLGQHNAALRALHSAQQILDGQQDELAAAQNLYHLAATVPYQNEGQVGDSIALAEQALQVFRNRRQHSQEAAAMRTLGYSRWLAGQAEAALETYEQAYRLHERLGEMSILPEALAYQALALLDMGCCQEALTRSRQALAVLAGLTLETDLNSEIYYAHAAALEAAGDDSGAQRYYTRAYQNLLKYAEPLEEDAARQAYFSRDPTVRRLMQKVYERGIANAPQQGVVRQWLRPRLNPAAGQIHVRLTLDAGPADTALKRAKGSIFLRRAKLQRIIQQAQAQGASPTTDELAALLGVSARTIKRDLAALRA